MVQTFLSYYKEQSICTHLYANIGQERRTWVGWNLFADAIAKENLMNKNSLSNSQHMRLQFLSF